MLLIGCRRIVCAGLKSGHSMARSAGRQPPADLFGKRVRTRRLDLGMSQEALAERSGLHRTYIGSLERGERNVALLNILRLADALDMDPAELVRGLRP
jgi:ribosome-binding protein aMBF1 (putative translation factor)